MKLTIKDLKTRNTSAVEVADDATFAALARLHALPGKEIRSEFQGGGGGVRMLNAPLLMRVTEASDPEPAAESPAGGTL